MQLATAYRFVVVGGVTALFYYAVLVLLIEVLGAPVMPASAAGYLLAVLLNYLLHHRWTFRSTAAHGTALARFALMLALGFVVNLLVMGFALNTLSLHYLLAQTLAIAVIATLNFAMSSLWVFR
jgi:putative flippase GtrA